MASSKTGQMWLKRNAKTSSTSTRIFCLSTSYRQEPNPVPGRHEVIFPMFEFEIKGGMDELLQMEKNAKILGLETTELK